MVLQNGNYAPSEGFRPPFASTKQWAYIDDLLPESDEKKVNKDPCSGCYYALNHKCAIDIKGYCPREEQIETMDFEKKKKVAKVLARSIMNTMMEQNVPLVDCVEIIGITAASICGGAPAPLEPREQVASFLAAFSATLSAGVKIKEGEK